MFVIQFSSVRSLSHVCLCATPWITVCQASLSITNSWSWPKPISIQSVMRSSHLILCHPFLLLPPIPPSIRVFSNESILHMRWPKYWSFSFNINPSNEHLGLISFRMDWLELLASKMAIKSLITYRTNTGLISTVPDLLFIPQYVGLLLKATVSNKWYHQFTLSK